jgi:hypothetical protein
MTSNPEGNHVARPFPQQETVLRVSKFQPLLMLTRLQITSVCIDRYLCRDTKCLKAILALESRSFEEEEEEEKEMGVELPR